MTQLRLILRSLWHHRRQHLSVAAGVAIATAVLTGALIVGDSVRYSLVRLVDIRLGGIREAAYSGKRYFRAELADEMSKRGGIHVIPALLSTGIAINSEHNLRIGNVQVIGADSRFFHLWPGGPPPPGRDSAIISSNVAERLRLKVGDRLLVRLHEPELVPSSAPFAGITGNGIPLSFTVGAVAPDDESGRFNLKNNQIAPFNIFIPLQQMASGLGIPGKTNLLAVADEAGAGFGPGYFDSLVRQSWQPEDAGLRIMPAEPHRTSFTDREALFQITTDRVFFDEATAQAVQAAIPGTVPILTYLVNDISTGRRSTPYSFVTAAGDRYFTDPPGEGELIVSDWLASDLDAGPGDSVAIRYYLVGPLRKLIEDSLKLKIKAVVPITSPMFDTSLMPAFPGMSSAGNCRDWESGIPLDLERIRDKDEQYWKDHRGTPKAFIAWKTGEAIWHNRFGQYTAFRFQSAPAELDHIRQRLMLTLDPAAAGISFRPVYREGLQAATGGNDFGELFLSLSAFLIFSAILLIIMLLGYQARLRLPETGILATLGFTRQRIRLILAAEAGLTSLTGAMAGVVLGMIYNLLLISLLNTVWQEAVPGSQLVVKINTATLAAGFLAGFLTAISIFLLVTRINLATLPAMALKDRVNFRITVDKTRYFRAFTSALAIACPGFTIAVVIWDALSSSGAGTLLVLAAGGALIPGGISVIYLLLSPGGIIRRPYGFLYLIRRNLALNRSRTLTSVALLAVGIFTIIITGMNRQSTDHDTGSASSGTGGFLLWGESTLPVSADLNTPEGRISCGLPADLPAGVSFLHMTRLEGDDASCLNLNQVASPALAGVPAGTLDTMQAFCFSTRIAGVRPDHPWSTLANSLAPDVIPAIADQTVITWGLRKKIGDTLLYQDEYGKSLKIKIVAGLAPSIFQGYLLISDSFLRQFYPSAGSTNLLLVKAPAAFKDTLTTLLESSFRDQGMMVLPARDRLLAFHAVENTYLSVFMILGGLGVIMGTIGLGIVVMRNIRQRQHEFSLYKALGFSNDMILRLILAEHTTILSAGMLLGIIASIPVWIQAIHPSAGPVPLLTIGIILLLILFNGLGWIWFPARNITRKVFVTGMNED